MSKTNRGDAIYASILIVEDDHSLSDWIKDFLAAKNFVVEQCYRGDDAVEKVVEWEPDILLLDGMLPGLDGNDVCRQVRPYFKGRIIMLTARNTDTDEITSLEHGADDYLSKPVRAKVLLARINTQLRHLSSLNASFKQTEKSESIRLGNLYLNFGTRTTMLRGERVEMTSKEFDMLSMLVQNAGKIVTRDELTISLRGFEYNGFDRSVDLTVSRLRRKLDDNAKVHQKIITVRGKGYILAKDVWQ